METCWFCMPIWHVGHVSYIWNVAAIFVELGMSNMCTVLLVAWLLPVPSCVTIHLYNIRQLIKVAHIYEHVEVHQHV